MNILACQLDLRLSRGTSVSSSHFWLGGFPMEERHHARDDDCNADAIPQRPGPWFLIQFRQDYAPRDGVCNYHAALKHCDHEKCLIFSEAGSQEPDIGHSEKDRSSEDAVRQPMPPNLTW